MALTGSVILHKCRVCLKTECTEIYNLYDSYIFEDVQTTLSEVIMLCTSIQMFKSDLLPQYICKVCVNKAKISYLFRLQCEKSDKILKNEVSLLAKQKEVKAEQSLPQQCR